MAHFDGASDDDRKLWQTYVFWARQSAKSLPGTQTSGGQTAIADDPANRVDEPLANALQTILFASFTIEYRMKRVLEEMGVVLRKGTTLDPLLRFFWKRLAAVQRIDKQGKCQPPPDWKICEPDLQKLVELRNAIAHADYRRVYRLFTGASSPASLALRLYNSVVEAVKLINIGTGKDNRPRQDIDAYFEPLKVVQFSRLG